MLPASRCALVGAVGEKPVDLFVCGGGHRLRFGDAPKKRWV